MARFEIPSFKYGLDTRKESLTSVVGSLTVANNVIVNSGGELQKRPGFKAKAIFAQTDSISNLPGVYFGLILENVGFTLGHYVVFGSSLIFGASITQGQPTLSYANPSYLTVDYQQLKHPSLYNDTTENYNAAYHRMTDLVYAAMFNGKSIAVAQFSDGNTFLYYDGALVQQSANGLVLAGRTAVADISNDALRNMLAIAWRGNANTDEDGITALNGSTLVKSPSADYFGAAIDTSTTNGLLGYKLIQKDLPEVPGTNATAKFKVTVAGTFDLFAPLDEAGLISISLTGGTVAAGTVNDCATAIIKAVNDFTSYHGYIAKNPNGAAGAVQPDEVLIIAPYGYDLVTGISLSVVESGGGATGAATGANPFNAELAQITPTYNNGALTIVRQQSITNQNQQISFGGQIGATISGGAGTTQVTVKLREGSTAGGAIQIRPNGRNPSTTLVTGPFPVTFSSTLSLVGTSSAIATYDLTIENGGVLIERQLVVSINLILAT